MLRQLIRVAILGLVATSLSLGLSSPGSAEPVPRPQVVDSPPCASAADDLATAKKPLARAKAKVAKLTKKVRAAQKKKVAAKKRVTKKPTSKNRQKFKKAKAKQQRLVKKRKAVRKKVKQARQARNSARTALQECRAAQLRIGGPVTGGDHGFPATTTSVDLAALGYQEQEYFIRGTARAYERDGAWTSDGTWDVSETDTAAYKTRLLVRAPQDPADFNGTVLVEWLNVSGNSDADVDWPWMHTEITRNGYAWVGVSAQAVGVNSESQGEANQISPNVVGLKNWDPTRYGSLVHPGDRFSYDIFSQAGRALHSPRGVDPLPGMQVEHLIAAGQSQSGFRMITYANAIQPVANVYDGIVIHARSGVNAPLGDGIVIPEREGEEGPEFPTPVRVRTDLDVPVMQLVSESELFETGGGPLETMFSNARQPDTDMIRTWEMAGTAHSDRYLTTFMNDMYQRMFEGARDLTPVLGVMNDGPQAEISSAALRAMRAWIIDGTAPGSADPIETTDTAIVRDEHGNAVGGVRTPLVDVPVATLAAGTIRFDAAQLHEMYDSHENFVDLFTAAADEAVAGGFLLPEDRDRLVAEAEASTVGDPVTD